MYCERERERVRERERECVSEREALVFKQQIGCEHSRSRTCFVSGDSVESAVARTAVVENHDAAGGPHPCHPVNS